MAVKNISIQELQGLEVKLRVLQEKEGKIYSSYYDFSNFQQDEKDEKDELEEVQE